MNRRQYLESVATFGECPFNHGTMFVPEGRRWCDSCGTQIGNGLRGSRCAQCNLEFCHDCISRFSANAQEQRPAEIHLRFATLAWQASTSTTDERAADDLVEQALGQFREASGKSQELASLLFTLCSRLKEQNRLEDGRDHLASFLRRLKDRFSEGDHAAGLLALGIMCQVLGQNGRNVSYYIEWAEILSEPVPHCVQQLLG